MTRLATESAIVLCFGVLEEDVLSENAEMGFMSCKTEHNKIGIQTIHDVPGVWVILGIRALRSNELHDLVLTFTRYTGVRDDDLKVSPRWICVELPLAPVANRLSKNEHKGRARRDDIAIPGLLDDFLFRVGIALCLALLQANFHTIGILTFTKLMFEAYASENWSQQNCEDYKTRR